jgi:hypothetical protein
MPTLLDFASDPGLKSQAATLFGSEVPLWRCPACF